MNQPTRLWELSDEIQQLEDAIAIIQEDETISDEERESKLEETFNRWLETEGSFKVKAEQVAAYIRHQEALTLSRTNEAKRLKKLAKQSENQAKRLRRYLTIQMQRTGNSKMEGITNKISLRKNPPILHLNVPPEKLPHHLVKVEYLPKKDLIKQELKINPDSYEWACLIPSETMYVVIK